MIEIKEVMSKAEMKQFIELPFKIYKDSPYWVPPMKKAEMESFDPSNAIFKSVTAKYFIALRAGEVVGRIIASINWTEVNDLGKAKVRFGWLEYMEDIDILRALMTRVEAFGQENNLSYLEGPMGFSNMDKAGMLTEGFEELATMIGIYNPSYYPQHLAQLGYAVEAEWLEYTIDIENLAPVAQMDKFARIIEERYQVKTMDFKSMKEMLPYVDEMFALLNKTYADLQSFVPIEPFQIEHYKNKYLQFLHPDFISCIQDKEGKMIAFSITMPSFSKAFQKAKGKLLPFGWWHLHKALQKNNHIEFYLIGIDPYYQNKGIYALTFRDLYQRFMKRGILTLETNPVLEENLKAQQLWKHYSPRVHKRRKTFRKDI